jgi:hypothetical protein
MYSWNHVNALQLQLFSVAPNRSNVIPSIMVVYLLFF